MIDWDALVIGPAVAIHGEPAIYLAKGMPLPGLPIIGVFMEAYTELAPVGGSRGMEPLDMGGMPTTSSTGPMLGVQLSQFPAPPDQGDAIVIHGQQYAVREVRPDGVGAARLLLNEWD